MFPLLLRVLLMAIGVERSVADLLDATLWVLSLLWRIIG